MTREVPTNFYTPKVLTFQTGFENPTQNSTLSQPDALRALRAMHMNWSYRQTSIHPRAWLVFRVTASVCLAVGVLFGTSKLFVNHPNWQPYLRDLPDFSAYALAAIGAALPLLPELLKMAENRRSLRWLFTAVCIVLALFAISSNHAQRVWDDKDKSAAREQLTNILNNQATHDDINRLDQHISDGFAQVIAAITATKPPPPKNIVKPKEPELPPALVQKMTITQRRVPSTDEAVQYGLQIVMQTNVTTPVAFAFHCTGAVEKMGYFLVGQGAYMNVQEGYLDQAKRVPFIKIGFPQMTPETPLVVTFFSKNDVRVISVEQIH